VFSIHLQKWPDILQRVFGSFAQGTPDDYSKMGVIVIEVPSNEENIPGHSSLKMNSLEPGGENQILPTFQTTL
jgi:hypothetical protein